jgi:uncharacterized lipoprotein
MKKIYLLFALLLVISLSACGITKKSLGFSRQGPDETKVQKNEPLVLPPEYNVRPQQTAENGDND